MHLYIYIYIYMGVSIKNGTPKSASLMGFSIINHPFWGTLIFGNIHIYMLYIIITTIQRSAVFWRSDIHPAACTLPSLRQAPAVFSFASETATCNTSQTIRNESWSDPIFVLKVDLSGFNSIISISVVHRCSFTKTRAPFSADLRSTPSESRIGIRIYILICIYNIHCDIHIHIFSKQVASESSSRWAACKSIAQRRC